MSTRAPGSMSAGNESRLSNCCSGVCFQSLASAGF